MNVKLLDDYPLYGLKENDTINIPDKIALELIAKGIAMKEKTIDQDAHDALLLAKIRDAQQ